MARFTGFGDTFLKTKTLSGGVTAQKLIAFPMFSFTYNEESTSASALVYRGGIQVEEETAEQSVVRTLTLRTQIADWPTMGLALDRQQKVLTNFTQKRVVRTTVPSNGIITDPLLVSGNIADVLVSVEKFGPWGQAGALLPYPGALPVPLKSYKVAVGSITFNAASAGAPVMYIADETILSGNVYGGPGSSSGFGQLEFFGQVFDNTVNGFNGGTLFLPQISRDGKPSIEVSGGVVELEMIYKCEVPSGWTDAYQFTDGQTLARI